MFKPNIEKLKAKGKVEKLIKALRYKDPDIRKKAANALGDLGDLTALEPLIEALENESSFAFNTYPVHESFALALARLDDNRAVEPLLGMLKISSPNTRRAAAEALGKIGDSRAVESLVNALMDNNMKAKEAAARALGEIGDASAAWPLIKLLGDRDGYSMSSAAEESSKALVKLGEEAIGPLSEAFDVYDFGIRIAAMEVLDQIGDSRAIDTFLKALFDPEKAIRERAVEYLDNMGWDPGEDQVGARYWVECGMPQKCISIGQNAIEALIEYYDEKGSYQEEREIIRVLGEIGGQKAFEKLINIIENNDFMDRELSPYELVGAIRQCGFYDIRTVEFFIEMLQISSYQERKSIATSLIEIAKKEPKLFIDKWELIKDYIETEHQDISHAGTCISQHEDKGIGLQFPDKPKDLDF